MLRGASTKINLSFCRVRTAKSAGETRTLVQQECETKQQEVIVEGTRLQAWAFKDDQAKP